MSSKPVLLQWTAMCRTDAIPAAALWSLPLPAVRRILVSMHGSQAASLLLAESGWQSLAANVIASMRHLACF